ncbi:MAG: transglycosylase domain-containing protein, partial [Firmicutes bacterium]|nr:transglycosylase domain-containing protein [Bacillota bacterium]
MSKKRDKMGVRKVKRTIKIVSILFAFLIISGIITASLILEPAIKISGYENLSAEKVIILDQSPSFFDKDGVLICDHIPSFIPVKFDQIPKHTIDAFVVTEDRRFFEHGGISYFRMVSALAANIKSGKYSQGASTITQQTVKNTHLTQNKTIKRKINEIRIAKDLERNYSKNEILEIYLNKIYFANGYYGIGTAARNYFNKEIFDLTASESALLAGIINNPSVYNPITNPKNANKRRRMILERMFKMGKIGGEEFETHLSQDLSVKKRQSVQYSYFLVDEACKRLGICKDEFFSKQYYVYTNLDNSLQKQVDNILLDYRFEKKELTIAHAIVMDTGGKVLANSSVGGGNLTNNFRQPGSTIKPMVCYAPAFEKRYYYTNENENFLCSETSSSSASNPTLRQVQKNKNDGINQISGHKKIPLVPSTP